MKFEFTKDKIIIYYKNSKEIEDKTVLEKIIKNILNKLKQKYNKDLNGSYLLNIYNNNYGIIFEIIDEKLELYFDKLDMEVKIIKNALFIYKIDFKYIKNLDNVFKYENEFYIKDFNLNNIEFVDVIYGDKANDIIKKCKKVKL